MNYLDDNYDLQDIDLEVMQNQTQSEYAKNVVDYISGYVVKKIVWPYFATFLYKYNIDVFPSVMKSSRFDGLIQILKTT